MSKLRSYYRIVRTILFSALVLVVAVYIGLYLLISLPAVQKQIKREVETQLSDYLGGELNIGSLDIRPFNEVRLKNVTLFTPSGEECLKVGTLGAGINLWHLLADRKIEITYGELLDLDARLWQETPASPINIQFIIDAVSPKDKSKPPTLFDLKIHNIVIRRSRISYDKRWITESSDPAHFNAAHIGIQDFNADITLPRIKNDDFKVDVRRIAFKEKSGIIVNTLAFKADITNHNLNLRDFSLKLKQSIIRLSDISLNYQGYKDILNSIETTSHHLAIIGENISGDDFTAFSKIAGRIPGKYSMNLDVEGTPENLIVRNLNLFDRQTGARVQTTAVLNGLKTPKQLNADIENLSVRLPYEIISQTLPLIPGIKPNVEKIVTGIGTIALEAEGAIDLAQSIADIKGNLSTSLGEVAFSGQSLYGTKIPEIRAEVSTDHIDLHSLFAKEGLDGIGGTVEADIRLTGKIPEGVAKVNLDYFEFKGQRFHDIIADAEKEGNKIYAHISASESDFRVDLNGEGVIDGADSYYSLSGDILNFSTSLIGKGNPGTTFTGRIQGFVNGNNEKNLTGRVDLDRLTITLPGKGPFEVNHTMVEIVKIDDGLAVNDNIKGSVTNRSHHQQSLIPRKLRVETPFVSISGEGKFDFKGLVNGSIAALHRALPSLIAAPKNVMSGDNFLNLKAIIRPDENLFSYFRLPVRPLTEVELDASYESRNGSVQASLTAPYLLQGTNKLITGSEVHLYADTLSGARINVMSTVPVKHGRAALDLRVTSLEDLASATIAWQMEQNQPGSGSVTLDALLSRSPQTRTPNVNITIRPSDFRLGPAEWNVGEARLHYADKILEIDKLRIWHDRQFVEIDGKASASPDDMLYVDLQGIDLSYIFGILNIEYVSFGGIATGRLTASNVFTKTPVARTEFLKVEDLAYNDAVLGDADITSRWNNEQKSVEINADIINSEGGGAKVDGGIFLTKDSLSFDMKADKIDIRFLRPFMAAFSSDISGRASGKMKLFGTFHDIDLVGKAYADSIAMKVDYTNVYYHGCDSVIMEPGLIRVPGFTLKDRNNNTAQLTGYVKHRYFHDPEFEFKVTDASNLLCYDTNSSMNPDWYGTIYASGRGVLRGRPGIVAIDMDMTTAPKSDFTFVLNETQTALDYNFLTFSDRRKEEASFGIEIEETIEDKYLKKYEAPQSSPSIFAMDLRVTTTPHARMTLVMDPRAGDKIEARGGGPLQISYDTESDQMKMYGKYTLVQGDYNFSLQDLILRNFKIHEGSSISFNGDPLQALLDIQAAYRVNTNLSDLDKSFSTDRDLNRTNVPVDALLNVTGNLQSPDITFDISLPTLTSDVERKVKSIISTDDMLNRQIIYLLALNRFYTPEYMATNGNGGELASVASSTISSQLSNIIAQMTDKVTFSPSFRSDKGDFSDMAVDLSLSSRLLNNRLLINGNFGYRDRSVSQTTFIGDFDIEYLLNRNGNLRLKAYNHFNDQNYYLKSSLTTQGLGIIYRKEFDNPFTFLKSRRRKKEEDEKGKYPDPQEAPENESEEEKTRIYELTTE
ncbi:MAG: translocation/assembly module TamB [Muribaculaceae bacterium]|nr:translocation/assembly module TamB [Muribaculaceae bacterium]